MGRRRQPFQHLTRLPVAAISAPPGAAPPAEAVERLAQGLKRQGQREPVLVTPAGNGAGKPAWRLVVGRGRLAAAQKLGWKELEAVVLDAAFAAEVGVIERLQAGAYDPLELAGTLARLQQRCAWTQAQLGAAIGRNRDFVAGLLALTEIAPDVRAWLEQHGKGHPLSARHLRYIGRAAPARQLALAREIVEQGLSVKALEQRLRRGSVPRQFIKVRTLSEPGRARRPSTTQQWRRYYRRLRTDLRRIDEQEAHELRRTLEQVTQARHRQRLIRSEARAKRQFLARELRRATRQLTRRGAL
jgi:ParB/RepB/Spo0J family partition protein